MHSTLKKVVFLLFLLFLLLSALRLQCPLHQWRPLEGGRSRRGSHCQVFPDEVPVTPLRSEGDAMPWRRGVRRHARKLCVKMKERK